MSDWVLEFGQSPSPYYGRAVHLAGSMPGYSCDNRSGTTVHRVPLDASSLPLTEALLRLVSGWQSTCVSADGIVLYKEELWALLQMLRCYRQRLRSGLGDLHCEGLPEGPRCRVPCRLIDRSLGWESVPEYVDPDLCARLVRAHAVETTALLCPAFDAEATVRALRQRVNVELLLDDLPIDFEDVPR